MSENLNPADQWQSVWQAPAWLTRAYELANSYAAAVGAPLIADIPDEQLPEKLFASTAVIVSHGTEDDPVLNYGNATALKLWAVDPDTLCRMPSRLTAEPMHRDERARMLERVTRDGYIDDYEGIRITADGRRFKIPKATVWNVFSADGTAAGQAATFDTWSWLS